MSRPHTLVVPSPRLGPSLLQLGALRALADAGGSTSVLATEAQMAVLDPTLLQWRLAHHSPESLALPISLERSSTTASVLRRYGFDEAVFLTGSGSKAVAAAARAGIPVRRGVGGWAAWRLTHKAAPAPDGHASRRDEPLLATMGLPLRPGPLFVPSTWHRTGLERLQAAKLRPHEEPLIGIYIGELGHARTGKLQRRLWPTERFEDLIGRLRRGDGRRRIVILGSDDDLWQTVLLHERTGKIHPVVGPDLHLDGLAAVLSHLSLVISADAAFLYLAAAVGTPTLALFHHQGRHPAADYEPAVAFSSSEDAALDGAGYHVIEDDLRTLSVDAVAARCERLLAGSPPNDP